MKKFRLFVFVSLVILIMSGCKSMENKNKLPKGFTYIGKSVVLEPRYFTSFNFTGEPVKGYKKPTIIATIEANKALMQANEKLLNNGYRLKVYDAYRPQRAVDSFVSWSKTDEQSMKPYFFPSIEKYKLFDENYIADKSSHSRGSTLDVTIINEKTGETLDMGSPFDFFGPISHHDAYDKGLINEEQQQNRLVLKTAMTEAGFAIYPEEWWHYTLKDEPYPKTYFNFVIE